MSGWFGSGKAKRDGRRSRMSRLMTFVLTCLESCHYQTLFSVDSVSCLPSPESIPEDGTDPAPLPLAYLRERGSKPISLETCLMKCLPRPLTHISVGGSSLTIRDAIAAPSIRMTFGALTRMLSAGSHHWARARFGTLIMSSQEESTPDLLMTLRCTDCGMTLNGPPKAGLGFPHPFPYRDKQNRVFYPPVVEGWYWGVEVKAAAELFSNAIHIYEGWVYEQEEVHESPFAFVVPLYEQRARWKAEGNGAQLAAKLALNSLYGKLAQRVGWNKETKQPPRWHQLEYAGYITATCRAMIYRAMMQAPADIIAVETDGIYSRVPLKLDEGTELGQWEAETFDEIIYVQSGVYWTVKNNTSLCGKYATVNKAKVRGFGSGSFSYRDAVAVVDYLNPLIGSTHRFGALSGFIGKPQLRQWMDNDRVAQWGGGGKRGHATKLCHKCNGNGSQLHNLVVTNFQGGASHPHFLPWRAAVGERNEYQEMADDERYAVVRL
jgi:hypothetical protein